MTEQGQLADGGESLRARVRAVIESSGISRYGRCDSWMRGHDPEFTARLAEAGLIGLSWPTEYGGRGATSVDRLVVTEELLRVAAPVAAHWIADRQIGPAILRHGSEELRAWFLPRIASGEVTFCLGMSETESGSDLAAVRTRAVADGPDFRITGAKIWTSHAHRSTHAYVLARTDAEDGENDPHATLSEFVVDLTTRGVAVRPIIDLAGEHHFNEVIFDDVLVQGSNVLGTAGRGWQQVTEQLAFERGGMERVLSTYPLLARVVGDGGGAAEREGRRGRMALGELVARLHALRAMAVAIASAMDRGEAPTQQAALLKHLGTQFENDVVEFARECIGQTPDPGSSGVRGLLAGAITAAPGATIRGGATEVLLGIVARGELRPTTGASEASDSVRAVAGEVLGDLSAEAAAPLGRLWTLAVELGWTGIGFGEDNGGSGGELRDLADIAWALGRHGRSAPIVETALGGAVRAQAGRPIDLSEPVALALGPGVSAAIRGDELSLWGVAGDVPWAGQASLLVVRAVRPDGEEILVEVDPTAVSVRVSGRDLTDVPRETLTFEGTAVAADAVLASGPAVDRVVRDAAVLRCAGMSGAMTAARASAGEHVRVRHQFGRPLARLQAVAHNIGRIAAEVALAEASLGAALGEAEAGGPGWRALAALVVHGRSATSVARLAHQCLGAMGITREHPLHLATLRLWAWRDELVPVSVAERRLGRAVVRAGCEQMWDWCVQETGELDSKSSPWRDI